MKQLPGLMFRENAGNVIVDDHHFVLSGLRAELGSEFEIVGEAGARREWHRSDASGQVTQGLQAPGQWLVRATWLEAPAPGATLWHSRFATLVVHAR